MIPRRHLRISFHRWWYAVVGIVSFSFIVPSIVIFMIIDKQPQHPVMGVTFSTMYATTLGLDWYEVFRATIDDLQPQSIRVPVYWNEIESIEGKYDFTGVQWMLDEAATHGVMMDLVIGRRVPRWPECHVPTWTRNMPEKDIQNYELAMMDTIVQTFHNHPALRRWQVENEPFFSVFGECPPSDHRFLKKAVALVRMRDPSHPIMMTESGELGTWIRAAKMADVLGVSVYRTTWNSLFGYFEYPLPPSYYRWKAHIVSPLVREVIVSELQGEPWFSSSVQSTPLTTQRALLSPKKLQQNIDYSKQIGLPEVMVWGVEWWYWMKTVQHDDTYWNIVRTSF